MKLIKSLAVGGKPVGLVREDVRLDISTPGRADFTVRSPVALSGIVQFLMGYAAQGNLVEFFTGYIEESHTVDRSQQRIFCRELAAVLWQTIPVSIRHASMKDILGVYSRKTGLSFTVPDKPYGHTAHHTFQTVANGIHGLDSLGAVFNIPDYIWQQQGDGQVFAGAWADSKWADMSQTMPENFFQDVQADGTKTLQAVPGLRPGVKLNGLFITSLQMQDHFMAVKCEKRLSV